METDPRTFRGLAAWVPPVLIAGIAALVFANTLSNGFHLDDHYRILDNPEVRHVAPIWRHFLDPSTISGTRGVSESRLHQMAQYRPLLPLTLSFNYAVGEYRVKGYHAVNILLHAVAAVLVYLLALEILRQGRVRKGSPMPDEPRPIALFVGLAFAVHPVSGVPVNYILARDLLLMEVFLIASLLQYLQMRRCGWTPVRWLVCLVCFALALMSKSTAAVAPLLVFAYEITVGGQAPGSLAPWRRTTPFAITTLVFYGWVWQLPDFSSLARIQGGGSPFWSYPLTQARVHLAHYLSNFFWPFPLRMAAWAEPARSAWEPAVLGGIVLIVISVWAACQFRRAFPLVAFGVFAYWILMLPESSIVPLHHAAVHYRPYPASPFLFLALGIVVHRALPPRWSFSIACLAIAYFAGATVVLNRTYRDGETLWSHSVRYGAEPLAHMNLAMSLENRRDPRVRFHLEEAVRRSPNFILAHVNLGLLDLDTGRPGVGLGRLERAAHLDPERGEPWYWLAIAYARVDRVREAEAASERAAHIDPRNPRYLYKAGLDASRTGDHEGALEYARRIAAIEPEYGERGFLEAFSLQMLGRLDEAVESYRGFLKDHPDHGQARFNLGHALMSAGDCPAAIPESERSLELDPSPAAHTHLAHCLAKLGNHGIADGHPVASDG